MSTKGRWPASVNTAGPTSGSLTTEPNTTSDAQDALSRNVAMPIGATGRINPRQAQTEVDYGRLGMWLYLRTV
jgi:hypothetical protein